MTYPNAACGRNQSSMGPRPVRGENTGQGPMLRTRAHGARMSMHKDSNPSPLTPNPLPLTPLLLLILLSVTTTGCFSDVDTFYGRGKSQIGAKSVNGTAVLAEMFETAGHKVASRDKLTPRLSQRADCIVWFPDDFQPPDEKHVDWFEAWLRGKSGRTLIYVCRDFDAGEWYWKKMYPDASTEQQTLVRNRMIDAQSEFRTRRGSIPAKKDQDCKWFTVEAKYQPRKVRKLQSPDPEWLEDVDPAKLEAELVGRVVPSSKAEVLLRSDGDVLLSSRRRGRGRVIVVANGSFLLNLPLVNHEHRKLAGGLIGEVGPPAKTVVFLESYAGEPPIFDQDPKAVMPTGMEIFSVWPTNWILLHLAAVGVIFCFSRVPIFGRPRQLKPEGLSDFGEHIRAVAELLQRTDDRTHAMGRVLHYQQTTKSGENT